MEEINRGLWAMGGCIVDFDSLNWYCKWDEFDFYYPWLIAMIQHTSIPPILIARLRDAM
jgi:hypothetical protein